MKKVNLPTGQVSMDLYAIKVETDIFSGSIYISNLNTFVASTKVTNVFQNIPFYHSALCHDYYQYDMHFRTGINKSSGKNSIKRYSSVIKFIYFEEFSGPDPINLEMRQQLDLQIY